MYIPRDFFSPRLFFCSVGDAQSGHTYKSSMYLCLIMLSSYHWVGGQIDEPCCGIWNFGTTATGFVETIEVQTYILLSRQLEDISILVRTPYGELTEGRREGSAEKEKRGKNEVG